MKPPPTQDLVRSSIVDKIPQLKRGIVWCHNCGRSLKVNSAKCLSSRWPECCGETMSIDSPEERKALTETGSPDDAEEQETPREDSLCQEF